MHALYFTTVKVLSITKKNLRIARFFASIPFLAYLCNKELKLSVHCILQSLCTCWIASARGPTKTVLGHLNSCSACLSHSGRCSTLVVFSLHLYTCCHFMLLKVDEVLVFARYLAHQGFTLPGWTTSSQSNASHFSLNFACMHALTKRGMFLSLHEGFALPVWITSS